MEHNHHHQEAGPSSERSQSILVSHQPPSPPLPLMDRRAASSAPSLVDESMTSRPPSPLALGDAAISSNRVLRTSQSLSRMPSRRNNVAMPMHRRRRMAPPDARNTVCRWWANGFCARGRHCWFRHSHGDDTASTEEVALPRLNPQVAPFQPAAAADCSMQESRDDVNVESAPVKLQVDPTECHEPQPECSVCYDLPAGYGLLGESSVCD